jgi:crossover junction endodeoxyribonuclease RusA
VTIFFFSDTEIGRDLDNVIKPILDALSGCVYIDDRQVEKLIIQRFEYGRLLILRDPSETLAEVREMDGPRIYIKVAKAGAQNG